MTLAKSPGLAGPTSLRKLIQLQTWLAGASLRETRLTGIWTHVPVSRPLLSPLRHALGVRFQVMNLLTVPPTPSHKNKCNGGSAHIVPSPSDTVGSTEGPQR